jgi:putative SOS response-associated peptidase YedK
MCARYNLRLTGTELREFLDAETKVGRLKPRYNISPSQLVLTLSLDEVGEREIKERKWGLIPVWAKEPKIGYSLINARAETVCEKPAFRAAIKKRRCLIPASGFYEWTGPPKAKQPWMIEKEDGEPMAFAGLWEWWKSPEGEEVESCTILTTETNSFMSKLHDRMPVILDDDKWDMWLDPEIKTGEPLKGLLEPYDGELKRTAMDPKMNSSRNEGKDIWEPLKKQPKH